MNSRMTVDKGSFLIYQTVKSNLIKGKLSQWYKTAWMTLFYLNWSITLLLQVVIHSSDVISTNRCFLRTKILLGMIRPCSTFAPYLRQILE